MRNLRLSIKSCGQCVIDRPWPLCNCILYFDWSIVEHSLECISYHMRIRCYLGDTSHQFPARWRFALPVGIQCNIMAKILDEKTQIENNKFNAVFTVEFAAGFYKRLPYVYGFRLLIYF